MDVSGSTEGFEKANSSNEDFAVELIKGLNFLINEAERSSLEVPCQIIATARADIVHWAINHDIEGDGDLLSLRRLSDKSGLLVALDLVSKYAAVNDLELKEQIMSSLEEIKKYHAGPSKRISGKKA